VARIVTVYKRRREKFRLLDMADIRWLRLSQALAEHGHEVDLATTEPRQRFVRRPAEISKRLRRVVLSAVDWRAYDVVLTLFHEGYETLEALGGVDHPGLLVELDSVVGPADLPGIYFYGAERQRLWETQCRIRQRSPPLILLTAAAAERWRAHLGDARIFIVPAGIDRDIPKARRDPFPKGPRPRCLFAGNIYGRAAQSEANRTLIGKLNDLGGRLSAAGARLYLLGKGSREGLDGENVGDLGLVSYRRSWNFLHWADVGIVLSAGERMDNNESSKIYHYLRAGLPVISESGFPNDAIVTDSGLGEVIESGRLDLMAQAALGYRDFDSRRQAGRRYVLDNCSWRRRAETILPVIDEIAARSSH
jgi:hypothetical protein